MNYVVCLFLSLLFIVNGEEKEKEIEQLPKCPHVDPYKNLEEWLQLDNSKCNFTTGPLELLSKEEKEKYDFGTKSFAFDAFASEKIGPRRDVGTPAHAMCSNVTFGGEFTTSVVIIHHNEALSVLLRMVIGIFERTPAHLLKEIILYEDASEEAHHLTKHLEEATTLMKWGEKVMVKRSEERQGLIRAKVLASRLASGDVLVFLDSHCEVTERWLEPLLDAIKENPKSVALPIVDLINPTSFEYSKAMVSKSGFDWALNFQWVYIPWEYFDEPENNVKPFDSPSMPGGLLAIRRDYFKELGEYDEGMEIWGAENVELSLKTWMCGGRVVVAPCSRVGHVFRMRRPYKSKPGLDTNLFNSLRVAEAWLGEYKKYFIRARPRAAQLEAGDVSYAEEVKKRLGCKDMKWYIDNIYPQIIPNDWEKRDEL